MKLAADLHRKARTVASDLGLDLADYLDQVLRPIIEQAHKALGDRIHKEGETVGRKKGSVPVTMPLVIGFTGARRGLTAAQLEALRGWLEVNLVGGEVVHHGACVGADEQFADVVSCLPHVDHVYAHPSDVPGTTSDLALSLADEVCEIRPPLARNKDIVALVDVLLACPAGMAEELRSGTWATVRYARKAGKRILIFWPDGSVSEETP